MATTKFESSVLKAMQLLHSPHKEATEQLKAIFDESLAQKRMSLIEPIQRPAGLTVKPMLTNRHPALKPASILLTTDDLGPSACIVCKRIEQKMGNEIVECQECRKFYHRECHMPNLESENVKDPRFVWYCSTCSNKRKRVKLPPSKQPPSLTEGTSMNKEPKEFQDLESSPFKSWSFMKK